MKSTNYYNTFIEIADDCPVGRAEIPPLRGNGKSIARMQYDMIFEHPYQFTSDDVIFAIFAEQNLIPDTHHQREAYFSKGRACLRSSSLGKRYGWGIHHNQEGKVAIYPVESDSYDRFTKDDQLDHVKAMRSAR